MGSQRSGASPGSRQYFEDIAAYRYGYETPFIPRLFDFPGLRGKHVLEIGVGNGIDAVEMVKCGAIYSGLDVTRNHLELTKKNFSLQPGLDFHAIYQGDLLDLEISERFDVIYSFGVLHHLTHEALYLEKIRGLLKKDGTLRIAVYSRYCFFNLYLLATWLVKNRMRNNLDDWRSHVCEGSDLGNPVTVKIRSKREVQRMLETAGFEVVKYHKRGFVQRYLPIVGRWLKTDGITLNFLGSVLGWYHIFFCRVS